MPPGTRRTRQRAFHVKNRQPCALVGHFITPVYNPIQPERAAFKPWNSKTQQREYFTTKFLNEINGDYTLCDFTSAMGRNPLKSLKNFGRILCHLGRRRAPPQVPYQNF
jgi:hypothetical protein